MSTAPGFAILGAGIFAKEAHLPGLAKLGNDIPTLRAVYSRSQKSASELAADAQTILKLPSAPPAYYDGDAFTDLDALLSRADIQSVLVILPISTQPSVILKALAAGKHVLSEKPVAPDVASAIKLIKEYEGTYKPKGLVWRVAENYEVEPLNLKAAQAVRDGKIGKVEWFRVQVLNAVDKNSKWYKTPWRTVPDYQGGFVLDGGVHTAAALRVILPSPITHLTGFASLNKDFLAPTDTVHAVAKTADGAHGIVEITFASPGGTYSKGIAPLTITGSEGWLTVGPAEDVPDTQRVKITRVTKDDKEEVEVIDATGHWQGIPAEQQSFFQALAGNDDGAQDPRGALKDLAFIQATLDSNGALVDLEALTKF
ncbi:oxidoreductase family protein [Auriscalpium vulgare]|uniref:Oxidoreductase family protein n=1 Tax=Auriscalpium vulgare TaxID=40419 RepID=A0ACB8RXL4_9AGAM|nr:oxidoreductase family protein [Auriscalpium vulgare]